jgi:hypothetical protein
LPQQAANRTGGFRSQLRKSGEASSVQRAPNIQSRNFEMVCRSGESGAAKPQFSDGIGAGAKFFPRSPCAT